ncbi:ABC transporter ATP-binding protein [Oceanivirga salmonicida]|uniref:ABC transporter ATP-binding protein n=1 Tax=Oceanivirga salmonicida TaxID=1769291 RepID=UPI0008367131|nr:ATP-binding cassette domain-containing protein [Oceanivirga salmonicida]
MIIIKNLKYQYKTYKKGVGFLNNFKDFFKRKYEYIDAIDIKSLKVDKGEIVGLLGPNGAGKTTLIKLMTGILSIENGEILCDNYIPYKKEENYLKEIGVVIGQKSQLIWDLPSIDTLKMLKDIYKINELEFNNRLKKMTNLLNLEDKINIPVRKLSLGERLKFELICSLIHKPKILFLDEPTIGVDIISQKAIHEFLLKLNSDEKTTIILTSHNMKDIEYLCRRIVVILKGKITLDTDIMQLKNSYKVETKYIIHTEIDEFPFKDIEFKKIDNCKFEIGKNNIISFEDNTKELEEIIYEIFKGDQL